MADVVLPVEIWAEQTGHFINLEGRTQFANRGIIPPEGTRSNTQVLQDIADILGFELTETVNNFRTQFSLSDF
jgi:NADH dehydrogenase/NADH:ubiquinone oxidoreductase subunit G